MNKEKDKGKNEEKVIKIRIFKILYKGMLQL